MTQRRKKDVPATCLQSVLLTHEQADAFRSTCKRKHVKQRHVAQQALVAAAKLGPRVVRWRDSIDESHGPFRCKLVFRVSAKSQLDAQRALSPRHVGSFLRSYIARFCSVSAS